MLRRPQDGLLEIGMFEQFHVSVRSLACQLRACESPASKPKVESGERIQGSPQALRAVAFFPISSAIGAKQSAHAGRLGVGNFEQALKAALL